MSVMKEINKTISTEEERIRASQMLGFPLVALSQMHQAFTRNGFDEQFDWDRKLSRWFYDNKGRTALYFDYDNNESKDTTFQVTIEKKKITVFVSGSELGYSIELGKADGGLHFNLSSIKQINSAFISKATKQVQAKGHEYWKEWNDVQSKLASKSLRSKVIRLAHQNPSLRDHLLPLVTKTAKMSDREIQQIVEDIGALHFLPQSRGAKRPMYNKKTYKPLTEKFLKFVVGIIARNETDWDYRMTERVYHKLVKYGYEINDWYVPFDRKYDSHR